MCVHPDPAHRPPASKLLSLSFLKVQLFLIGSHQYAQFLLFVIVLLLPPVTCVWLPFCCGSKKFKKKSTSYPSLKELLLPLVPLDTSKIRPDPDSSTGLEADMQAVSVCEDSWILTQRWLLTISSWAYSAGHDVTDLLAFFSLSILTQNFVFCFILFRSVQHIPFYSQLLLSFFQFVIFCYLPMHHNTTVYCIK